MEDTPRLIEHAFPLKQASLDSVHEKNVRHGHISTLHIWPARRPLAACRAALIATLLPDPSAQPKPEGMSEEEWHKEIIRQRQELCEKIGGKVVKKIEKKRMPNGQVVEREKEVTEGGILHWGRETENAADLEWFRKEIRKAYGGRAPKILDPFAGGGAIPLEAMRLGCEATAVDINPVAWFILKCTLEYPQKLAGKTWPLPDFILENEKFMEAFYKAHPHLIGRTKWTKRQAKRFGGDLFLREKEVSYRAPQADLAWHVRAWGQWVLDRARRELAQYYPTYADFEPLDIHNPKPYEKQPMRLVPLKEDGTPDVDALNAEFSKEYLADKQNPRWVAKPTVAYLSARTVTCKNCRATIPLLKTRWLCKRDKKRVLLTMEPNADNAGVNFGIENNVPVKGGNTAQRREHDKRLGAGTMSRSGARCPCCPAIMTMEDIRLEGQAGRLGAVSTAVVVDGQNGKQYRLPTEHEREMAGTAADALSELFAEIPFGMPDDPLPSKEALGFRVPLYGFDRWSKLFTPRQLLALGTFVKWTRAASAAIDEQRYVKQWREALCANLAICLDKLADRQSALCRWDMGYTKVHSTFARFALPILWDFCQGNPLSETTGSYISCVEWVAQVAAHASAAGNRAPSAIAHLGSAIAFATQPNDKFDAIVTDPPYYDAIPYSDLMDFFYIWLRRTLHGVSSNLDEAFNTPLSPKWNHEKSDGELIDDASRHGGNAARSKQIYEDGMFRAFQTCSAALSPDGKLVIVFAHKQPDAWETLVSAIIRAGFVVDGSWPIQTEMSNRMRALSGAALASSVWLVCKKRPAEARPGWDNHVLEEMRKNIRERLREFWDAGIRGPDFVWAATGPALEAYSKHPVVKKANDPGQVMTVSEFLTHVRRMVVDFVVGRVMYRGDDAETRGRGDAGSAFASQAESPIGDLDEPTAYYLLHRHDFGMDEAPAGACILYAISCGISDKELAGTWDLIGFTKGKSAEDEVDTEMGGRGDAEMADEEADPDAEEDSGSKVKLKTWAQRKGSTLGYEAPSGKPVPLIDRAHCLMHLWRAGDLHKVDEYLDGNGLRRQELFKRLLQSLIELSPQGSEERSLLESISNHIGAKGAVDDRQLAIPAGG
jgi:adenine-specific DNA methylase